MVMGECVHEASDQRLSYVGVGLSLSARGRPGTETAAAQSRSSSERDVRSSKWTRPGRRSEQLAVGQVPASHRCQDQCGSCNARHLEPEEKPSRASVAGVRRGWQLIQAWGGLARVRMAQSEHGVYVDPKGFVGSRQRGQGHHVLSSRRPGSSSCKSVGPDRAKATPTRRT